jgi:hypothetical protein
MSTTGLPIKLLNNQKLDIDLVENPEGLPYAEFIVRDCASGRITGWHSLAKEAVSETIKRLQRIEAVL